MEDFDMSEIQSESTKTMGSNTAAEEKQDAIRDEYRGCFIPSVHKIGRSTMAVAFVLSFLPTIYFFFVKGYQEPISAYINVAISISSIGIGMWLTEPLAYWPVLGSAGTYISYLSGNVSGMRFPVALSLQSTMKADINTPRGQIITIVGIVSSVFVNLGILLVVVLAGNWLVSVLPDVVIAAFSFVMVGLLGSMILMRFNGPDGIKKGFFRALPYLICAIVIKLVTDLNTYLSTWGMAISVGCCILLAYVLYKRDCRKDEEEEKGKD